MMWLLYGKMQRCLEKCHDVIVLLSSFFLWKLECTLAVLTHTQPG